MTARQRKGTGFRGLRDRKQASVAGTVRITGRMGGERVRGSGQSESCWVTVRSQGLESDPQITSDQNLFSEGVVGPDLRVCEDTLAAAWRKASE